MRASHVLGLIATTVAIVAIAPSCSSSDGASDPGQDASVEATPCDPTVAKCQQGGACAKDGDCANLNCVAGVCAAPSCNDNKQDQTEQGIDCGGPCKACDGAPCTAGTDCKSTTCAAGVCGPSAGKTCGVGLPNMCELNDPCGQDKDCKSIVCTAGKCAPVTADTHTDGRVDGGETDVDCGGTTGAPICKEGKNCVGNDDCEGLCSGGKCAAPTHTDGKISPSLGETDVDCGGTMTDVNGVAAKVCGTGKKCGNGTDCESRFCGVDGKCEPRKIGRKDGDESDIDCGGTADPDTMIVPPRCADDLGCNGDGDCSSTFCNTSLKKCVAGRSCKGTVGNATAGITTCGKRETTDVTNVHESCCRSLPLPGGAARLDKYEATSGRVRQFIESVGPNMRKWVNDEINNGTPTGQRLANDIPASELSLLPASATPGEPLNLVVQIGATVMDVNQPSMVQGCYNDYDDTKTDPMTGSLNVGTYGANTYWWDAGTLQAHFGKEFPTAAPTQLHHARKFTKAQYDEKSMNCAAYWIYAAFCAWDGGRMPTDAEVTSVWGGTSYPYNTNAYPFPLSPGQGQYAFEQTANYYNNRSTGWFYHFPDYGDAWDTAGYIAAPGRFILDATSITSANGESWMDLGANLMELTRYGGGNNTFCDWSVFSAATPGVSNGAGDVTSASCFDADTHTYGVVRATGLPSTTWVGGSWEGHRAFSTALGPPASGGAEPFFTRNSYTLPTHTQYGKTGVRCAR